MSKLIKGFAGIVALLMGINGNSPAEAAKPKEMPKTSIEEIAKAEYNEKRISENAYIFKAAPAKAGRSTQITVIDYLMDKKDPVEKIVLYENGRKTAKGANFLSTEIKKDEAGKSVYNAELIFKSGDKIKTKDIEVSFEGKPIDFAPVERWFYATKEAGKAARITIEGEDIGDNKGIEKIVLYENGSRIAEEKGDRMYTVIERPAGKFKYHAEIIDKGGNITKTAEREVSFLGRAFAPEIYWFFASPKEKAGKSVRIIAEADDKKNLDKNAGIEKLILYENGMPIQEVTKNDTFGEKRIYSIITKENAGNFKYHVEAVNKNGEKARSKEISVAFTGKDLPPEIFWFTARVKEDGYRASICLDAKDDDNVRDNAGIKEILLYENGNMIHREEKGSLYKEIVHHDAGNYSYHVEVINNSGMKATTKPLELKFF